MNLFPQRLPAWALAASVLLGSAQPAHTATVSPYFEPTYLTQGTALLLNGSGTRVRAIFKVYEMALYTSQKVHSATELLNLPGPKRLQFIALRDLSGTDLGLLFIKGLQANSSKELVQRHALSTTRLIEIFSGKPKLVSGDSFAMEFIPGKGTQFFIAGIAQGVPVGDAEFFNMILRIWFGPSSVDTDLRDQLLNNQPAP